MPVSGEIVEVNPKLDSSPELVNNDCYGDGWLVKIKLTNAKELDNLMSAHDYTQFIAE